MVDKSRIQPIAAAFALTIAFAAQVAANAEDRLPNVVVLLADDLGYGGTDAI